MSSILSEWYGRSAVWSEKVINHVIVRLCPIVYMKWNNEGIVLNEVIRGVCDKMMGLMCVYLSENLADLKRCGQYLPQT